MVTASEAKACVDRLACLPSNRDPEMQSALRGEVLKTFLVQCASRDAAERLTARLLQQCQFFPTPSEVIAAAEVNTWQERPRWSCSNCGGTGWAASFGTPIDKGKLSRLDIAAIREQMGPEGWQETQRGRVPLPAFMVARWWARINKREVCEVSEMCMCKGAMAA